MGFTTANRYQIVIFSIGWIGYCSTYFIRKPLGVIKTDLQKDLNFTKNQLGMLDLGLLLPYALVQMFLGGVGDYFGARPTYSIALVLAALSVIGFGYSSSFYTMMIMLVATGGFQAFCWPNSCKLISHWFSDQSRNTVFGTYGTSAFAGGIIGTAMAVQIQMTSGWRAVYVLPSFLVIIIGVVSFFAFREPDGYGVTIEGKANVPKAESHSQLKPHNLGFFALLSLPTVIEMCAGMFTLKLIRYAMYMWLPMFLTEKLNYSVAQGGIMSTSFEVGGVIGSTAIGYAVDRYFPGRALDCTGVSMLVSAVALLMFIWTSAWGVLANCSFMILAGAFSCACDGLLGGSIASEVGEMDGRNAAAAVVGLVNGMGTLGGVLEGPLVGFMADTTGWDSVFVLMIILSLVGAVAMLRARTVFRRYKLRQAASLELG